MSRPLMLALWVGVLSAAFLAATPAGAATSPPNGVYTCSWIAANPAAAAEARVGCGDLASTPTRVSEPSASPLAQGCQNVPASGSVGKGVFAWSTYEYATSWAWSTNLGGTVNYTWYIQQTTGVNYTHGDVFDNHLYQIGVPGNVYRWGAQNHSTSAQSWHVCYSSP